MRRLLVRPHNGFLEKIKSCRLLFYINRCQIFRVTFVRKVSVIARLRNNHCSWIGPFITCRYIEKNLRGCYQVGHNSAC